MKQKFNYGNRRQQGIALPITMVILVLAALVTIYTTTTSVKEQQVTADQYRSEQAFAAAQSGVDDGLKRHNDFPELDINGNPVGFDERDVVSVSGFSMGSYKTMFCDIWDQGDDPLADGDATPDTDDDKDGHTSVSLMADFLADTVECTNPINPADSDNTDIDGFKNDERVGILSVGKPDDNSGRRTISVVSAPDSLFSDGGPPAVPLTAKGPVGLGGGDITIINRYSNITVWTGGEEYSSSGAVSTYISNLSPTTASRGDLIYVPRNTPGNCGVPNEPPVHNIIAASCQLVGVNADILKNDANLKNIEAPEMFERIFSASKTEIRDLAKSMGKFYPAGVDIPTTTGLIWKEASPGEAIILAMGDLDDPTYKNDAPAFLVIDVAEGGIVSLKKGDDDAFGMIFVFGNVELGRNIVIIGSMIVTKDVSSSGGPMIIYDDVSLSINPEGLAGMRGIEPGTWKDWGYVN